MAKKKAINQVGRPQHLATEANKALVRDRYAHGIPQEAIAEELGISPNTLAKHYSYELKTARTPNTQQIVSNVITMALEGDKDMIKLYLEKLGGEEFRQKANQLEISGPNGGAIPVQRFDFDALPIEQTRYLEKVLDAVVVNEDKDDE
jgi:transcriptional regulator with XRE-family HTH domain